MNIDKTPKNAEKFSCENCDFKCSKKCDWIRHINRPKHKKTKNDMYKTAKNAGYNCTNCERTYKYYSGLWKHSKICKKAENIVLSINNSSTDAAVQDPNALTLMVVELMKSNQDLQKQMLELCKTSTAAMSNSTINSHNNNNNKTFNMQFFLNEQCKDAMNIMDFVNTFKLEFSDLEKVGEVGYVEGMSNIIIQKLNAMDIYKRPIHCSDVKRETLYVRDKNVWEKENETHDKLRLAIKHIAKKNTDMLNKWSAAHPGSCDSDNYLNDVYMEIVMQAMGGRGNREDNENKIMRKIARSVLIDKDMS
jgi:hypothetical protein